MHVVKNHGNKALRKRGRFHRGGIGFRRRTNRRSAKRDGMRARSLRGKGGDGLTFLAIVELEILLLQVGNYLAVQVAHHDAHQHIIDANLESCRSILTGNLFSVLLGTGGGFGRGGGDPGRGRRRGARGGERGAGLAPKLQEESLTTSKPEPRGEGTWIPVMTVSETSHALLKTAPHV